MCNGKETMQTMNRDSDTAMLKNPWLERGALPPVPSIHKIFAAIAVFLSALGLPICLWEGISASVSELLGILLLALLCAYVIKVARSTPALSLLLCTAFVLTFLVGLSFTGGAMVLAVTVSLAAGAFLTTVTGRPYLILLCHAAAFGVSFAITRDPVGSLLTLSVLPASLLMAYATLKGMGRTKVICLATGGLLLTAAVMLVFHLLYVGVPFEREALIGYIDTLRTQLLDLAISTRNETAEVFKSATSESSGAKLYEQFMALYTDEMLQSTVVLLFNLLPALLIVFSLVLAYEASSFLIAAHKSAGLDAVNTDTARRITVSVPASIVYFLSFLLMMLLPGGSLASAVVQNLALILMPGLALFGANRILLLLYRLQGSMRFLLLFGILALVFCNVGSGLYMLAIWGAYSSIGDLLREILIERLKRNGDGGEPRE